MIGHYQTRVLGHERPRNRLLTLQTRSR